MKTRPSETRTVAVTLTEEEVRQRGRELALKQLTAEQTKLIAKQAAARFKEQLDALNEEIKDLSGRVHTGREPRPVVCFWRIERLVDARSGVTTWTWVLETEGGERITTEAVGVEDRQEDLPLADQ